MLLPKTAKSINNVINDLAVLPGLGPRSAKKTLLYLLQRPRLLENLLLGLNNLQKNIRPCVECFNWDEQDLCLICQDKTRDQSQVCIVENIADLWVIENSGYYKGLYHVLGGIVSPLHGVGPEQLNLKNLEQRTINKKEIIIALSSTLDGQTTVRFLQKKLRNPNLTITTLAQGIPLGSDLDYVDENTLIAAFIGRKSLG